MLPLTILIFFNKAHDNEKTGHERLVLYTDHFQLFDLNGIFELCPFSKCTRCYFHNIFTILNDYWIVQQLFRSIFLKLIHSGLTSRKLFRTAARTKSHTNVTDGEVRGWRPTSYEMCPHSTGVFEQGRKKYCRFEKMLDIFIC